MDSNRFRFECCGLQLRTKNDVLRHYTTRQLSESDRWQPLYVCEDHIKHWRRKCWKCRKARWINTIDRSLWPRGLTLSYHIETGEY